MKKIYVIAVKVEGEVQMYQFDKKENREVFEEDLDKRDMEYATSVMVIKR
jgi:hypothetical protein|tara:strand:+ start:76 stop:225 length:150 start_codon:yes stop_codon:yes gene_type:complete